jgi:Uma2 family endonuclease
MATGSDTNLNNSFPTLGAVPIGAPEVVAAPTIVFPDTWTIVDFQAHLGDIPAERIRLDPKPGHATEEDLVRLAESKEALCELVDGILVEKPVGMYESAVAASIIFFLKEHVRKTNSGVVSGESGGVRTVVPQVRMPDACYISRDQFSDGRVPRSKVLPVAPDLAIEVLSESNTRKEMARKLKEYFRGGTRLVWYIDPAKRTAQVFTSESEVTTIRETDGVLDGGDVLPGFRVSLKDVFDNAGPFED